MATKRTTKARATKKPELDLKNIVPKTFAQEQFVESFQRGLNIIGVGHAGTGKNYISLWLALNEVISGRKRKIVIVRNTIQTRDMGFMPGSLAEKLEPFVQNYREMVNDLCQCGTAYDTLVAHGRIEFLSTTFIRGITIDNAVIIADEIQNLNQHEAASVLTRVGENTSVILIGDHKQSDLNPRKEESCFNWLMRLADRMTGDFDVVRFMATDVVRSGFCKRLIIAMDGL